MTGTTPPSLADLALRRLLDDTAARTPVPGGGAVAAMTLAQGAALGRMVIAFSVGRKAFASHADLHAESESILGRSQSEALRLADEDAAQYAVLNSLYALDRDDPKRVAGWADAVEGALSPPLAMMSLATAQIACLEQLVGRTSRMLASDLAIAGVLTDAGGRAAAWNVRVNLPLLEDQERAQSLRETLATQLATLRESAARIESACGA